MGAEIWDEAGLTDINSQLGRPVASGLISVPSHVELSSDNSELVWSYGSEEDRHRHAKPDREMLTRFVRLWQEPPKAVLRFARRWGVLNHRDGRPCQPIGPFKRHEPVEAWRYYSRRAHAILNIAANLRRGELGTTGDWEALHNIISHSGDFVVDLHRYGPFMLSGVAGGEYPSHIKPDHKRSLPSERYLLSVEVGLFLRLGRVSFMVGTKNSGWNLEVDYNGCMLAVVALQLALVLADVDTLYRCTGCQEQYVRKKKAPKPGQANFCDNCGHKKAVQVADERRRAKMAEARRLAEDHLSVPEVATRLNSSGTTVRRWINKGKSQKKPHKGFGAKLAKN